MIVTQAILPVEVNYTPMYKRDTDKNVCATTNPQKNSSLRVTQAILPVEINYTPMYKRNTDKNVCATTDPQKNSRGIKF
jgi:hypothetical protein